MPGEDVDVWDAAGERFIGDFYGSLRGRVRTHVIDQHLRAHLGPAPQRIVDVGGGAGHQSLPLARSGHDVTIVDPSPAMLGRAEDNVAAEDRAVRDRVRLIEARGEVAPEVLAAETFDAVLCHGVLMYLDDPVDLLDALCRLADPGGIVSIVARNAETMAMRPAQDGDWAAALAAFDSDRQVNGLDLDTRGDRVEHLSALLAARGVDPVAWYGVRLFTDLWSRDRPPDDPEDLVLEAELRASRTDPYRRLSRLFHLIGRRPRA